MSWDLMNNPSAFVVINQPGLYGSTAIPVGSLGYFNDSNANQIVNAGNGARLDKVSVDFAAPATSYAKQAASLFTLTGTTPITISLGALAAATGVQVVGDTSFATAFQFVFANMGTSSVTFAPAGSNGYGGPTLTVPPGSVATWQDLAGLAITGTTDAITVTPAASGSAAIAIGGA
jgi:hypothetical protein